MEKNLKSLLIDELHDILSAEEQIIKALPDLVKASDSADLKAAFETHLKETRGQVQRLGKIFKLLSVEKEVKFCKGTKGLIDECKEVLKEFKKKSPLRDAALISKAQRIEHYEISAYGTVRTFADELGLSAVADLLQETLDEEGNANKKLTKLAEGGLLTSGINRHAHKLQAATKEPSKAKSRPKAKSLPKAAPKRLTSTRHASSTSSGRAKTTKRASSLKSASTAHASPAKTAKTAKSASLKPRSSPRSSLPHPAHAKTTTKSTLSKR